MEDKCLVAEFLGLWGYEGKNTNTDAPSDATKLFEAIVLHAHYTELMSHHSKRKREQTQPHALLTCGTN